jgi:hypothetical protein
LGILCEFLADDGVIGITGGTVTLTLNGVEVASVAIPDYGIGYPDFRPAVHIEDAYITINGYFKALNQLYKPPTAQAWDPT